MRKFLPLFCAIWVMYACGQTTIAEPQTTTQPQITSATHTPAPLPTIATATPLPTNTPQPELSPMEARDVADSDIKQQLQDAGFDGADSEYIARTGVATQQLDATTWRVMLTTPTGHLIDQTISYAIGNPADIAKPIQRDSPVSDETGAFAYSYTISATDAPAEIIEALQSAPVAYRPSRMMMIGPPVRIAMDVDAISVYVKGFIKQFGKDKFGDFTKEYDKLVPDSKFKLNDRWNAVKASMYVLDAVWMFEKIWPYLNAIDYLQACAEKPWNPLTAKSFREYPQDQQRIIERLESARSEIKYEGLNLYTIVMNKVLLMGIPGLSTVTKFLFGETLNNLTAETEQRLKNLVAKMEKMVPPCNGWRFVQQAQAGYLFTFEGTKCGGIDGNWTVFDDTTIEGTHILSTFEITVSEEEWLQGKKDFRYVFEQKISDDGGRSEIMYQGFTKNIIFSNQTVQFELNNLTSCTLWGIIYGSPPEIVTGCREIPERVQFTAPSSPWVEDESICQAEKADMMRFHNWQP